MHVEFLELIGTMRESQAPQIIVRVFLEGWAKTMPAGVRENPSADSVTHYKDKSFALLLFLFNSPGVICFSEHSSYF